MWLLNGQVAKGAKRQKLANPWAGPYVIEQQISIVSYLIRPVGGGTPLKVHVDRIKPFTSVRDHLRPCPVEPPTLRDPTPAVATKDSPVLKAVGLSPFVEVVAGHDRSSSRAKSSVRRLPIVGTTFNCSHILTPDEVLQAICLILPKPILPSTGPRSRGNNSLKLRWVHPPHLHGRPVAGEEQALTTKAFLQHYRWWPLNTLRPSSGAAFTQDYEVAAILAKRCLPGGQLQYLVRWMDYSSDHDEWLPETALECSRLVREFEADQALRARSIADC